MPETGPNGWEFFLGACLLTGAAILPHAAPKTVAAGMALAAVLRWLWFRVRRKRD